MKLSGLTSQQVEESRRKYGANTLTEIPSDPLWKKILEGFKDPMLMILMVALAVQVALFFLGQAEWFEPVGILIAILVANGVASVSENKQEGKASALKAEEEAKETAKVIRNLERSCFLSRLDGESGGSEERRWGGVALENYRFPWDRAFEIGMDIRLGEFQP